MRRNKLNVRRKTKELAERGSPITKRGKNQKIKDTKQLAATQIKNNGKKHLHSATHGAFLFQHSYYNGSIDRRSHLGQIVSEMEFEYAQHMGYQDFASCPITLREQVRLLCGNWIFQAFYRPTEQTLPHLRASENLTHRITRELGIKPEPRPVKELQTYMSEKYGKEA